MSVGSEWPLVKLGNLCEISIGKTPSRKNPEYWGPGHPWLSIRDMNQGRKLLHTAETITDRAITDGNMQLRFPGTILFSFKLSIGKVGIAGVPLYTNEAIAALLPISEDRIDRVYLSHFLQFLGPSLTGNRAVMGITLNKKTLAEILVPLPSLEEQKRIAKILDQVSKSIEEVNAQLSKFDELIQAHFHQQFSEEFIITEPLGDVASLIGGKSIVAKDSEIDSKFKVLKVSAITSGKFLSNQVKNLPADYQPPRAHLIRPNDLLISRASGSSELVGATILVPDDIPENLALPDKIWRFDWKNSQSSPHFYEALLSTPEFKQKILHSTSGSGASFMKNISKANLLQIPVPKVSFQDQAEFTTFAMKVKTLKAKSTQKLQLLTELQASLQTRAFQGLL